MSLTEWISFFLLVLKGVYISKTSYVREGEKNLDFCYRPYHVVEYYRYMRFYVDGKIWIYHPVMQSNGLSLVVHVNFFSCGLIVGAKVVLRRTAVMKTSAPFIIRFECRTYMIVVVCLIELRSSRRQFNSPTPTRRRIKSSRNVGELVFNPVQLIRS